MITLDRKALLEKAMKARRETETEVVVEEKEIKEPPRKPARVPVAEPSSPSSGPAPLPSFLQPTKAFKVQSVIRTAKQVVVVKEVNVVSLFQLILYIFR